MTFIFLSFFQEYLIFKEIVILQISIVRASLLLRTMLTFVQTSVYVYFPFRAHEVSSFLRISIDPHAKDPIELICFLSFTTVFKLNSKISKIEIRFLKKNICS